MPSFPDVAPFTGAWIETLSEKHECCPDLVAPFTGAWIETIQIKFFDGDWDGRTLYGCVD